MQSFPVHRLLGFPCDNPLADPSEELVTTLLPSCAALGISRSGKVRDYNL